MNAERSSSGFWLVPVLVGFAAAAAGLGAGWFLHDGASQPSDAPVLPGKSAGGVTREEFEGAQRALLARLDELAKLHAAGSGSASASSDGPVIELGHRIDELESRVALLRSSVRLASRSPDWGKLHGAGSGSMDSIIERLQEFYDPRRNDGSGADVFELLSAEHRLWTIEDVLNAYGLPREVNHNSAWWSLFYGDFRLEGQEEPCTVEFAVIDGYVDHVSSECDKRFR
jgi:hypothetical protein